ncbi:unnamed protein product [Rotaria sp. Silwood2]|nr:unnamed protein product [Rotaria sp. Silwood2]CAF4346838.1 unnamed protein product [Rotaria sp. Silwood2]
MSSSSSDIHVFDHVASGWESVRAKFEQNLVDGVDVGACLCVHHLGECVVNLSGGWRDGKTKKEPYTPDTLQLIFSTSKGIAAAAAALCVESGWLDYQAPVAKYWPEFAVNGKENISVSDVLAHRAGLPCVDQQLTVEDVFDWGRMASLLAEQKPYWEPGSTHGYHAHTIGVLVGELIQRVDPQHRSYSQFVRDELDPEFYVGVSDDKVEARIAPLLAKSGTGSATLPEMDRLTEKSMTCSGAFPLKAPSNWDVVFNQPRTHQAVMPAVNGISNAHSLARIYALLIGDVNENDTITKCLLSKKTLQSAIENVTPLDERDHSFFGLMTEFSRGGFELRGDFFKVLGEDGFGHKGELSRDDWFYK